MTLQQVGPNVVATGSGAIDPTGLGDPDSFSLDPEIRPNPSLFHGAFIYTGPISSSVSRYPGGIHGPHNFGSGFVATAASSGSGDMVGIRVGEQGLGFGYVYVPAGYVSGTALSDMAIYSDATFATLGVTPGNYVWTWGPGANQKFTLKILSAKLPAPKITNLSTRASVQTGEGVTIAGFIVTGTVPKQVVIRGLGPSLSKDRVPNPLQDPTLDLHDTKHSIQMNNDWQSAANANQIPVNLRPSDPRESAILITLNPGKYTAILAGNNGTTGIGLVEVYDITRSVLSEFTNISTRGFVGTSDNVMIAGFITNGSTQVLVRGLGPSLAQSGVSGVLADPVVSLVDGNGNVVQSNNNWKDTDEAAITATGKAPHNDLEAAILTPVAAGNYTAILSGNGGGTGIGLLEVYK